MKKTCFGIGFCVSALLALLCLVLCVLTLFTGKVEGVFVKEPISASASALDASRTQYGIQVRGLLFNDGNKKVKVDAVKVLLRNDGTDEMRELQGFEIEARTSYDLFCEWESNIPFDSVDSVELVIEGETMRLSNRAPSILSVDTLLFLTGAVILSILSVFFAKKSYYIYQEEKMRANGTV